VLLHALDGADRVGLGRREEPFEASPDHVRAAERVRGADDREEVVALAEAGQRPRDPFDVGYSLGRRNGTSAPYQRATFAISSLSVETTMRSKTPDWRAVSIA
jgi:hypothetical protein